MKISVFTCLNSAVTIFPEHYTLSPVLFSSNSQCLNIKPMPQLFLKPCRVSGAKVGLQWVSQYKASSLVSYFYLFIQLVKISWRYKKIRKMVGKCEFLPLQNGPNATRNSEVTANNLTVGRSASGADNRGCFAVDSLKAILNLTTSQPAFFVLQCISNSKLCRG